MKTIQNYKPMQTYSHDGKVYWKNRDINYTVTYYDNATTVYTFDCPLSEQEQQQISDYITLNPFLV